MPKYYAIGKVKERRKLIAYKILDISNYNTSDIPIEEIKKGLTAQQKRIIIGNLYVDEAGNLCEYNDEMMLPEYNKNGKRIGFAKDVYLTLAFAPSTAGRSAINYIYYSKDELVEQMELAALARVESDTYSMLPIQKNKYIDLFVEYYAKLYERQTLVNPAVNYKLDTFGRLTCVLPVGTKSFKVNYCKALDKLTSHSTQFKIGNLLITRDCEAVLPNAIENCKIDKLTVEKTILCQDAFKDCLIGTANLKMAHVESKLDLFNNCRINHLILPRWYDSWKFLDDMNYPIKEVELTNMSCTEAIWEITTKDKLQFKKIQTLILPIDFEDMQEEELRSKLPASVIIKRRLNDGGLSK